MIMITGINPNNAYIPAKPSCAETLLNAIIEKIIMARIDNKPKMKKKVSLLVILFEVEFFMVWVFLLMKSYLIILICCKSPFSFLYVKIYVPRGTFDKSIFLL